MRKVASLLFVALFVSMIASTAMAQRGNSGGRNPARAPSMAEREDMRQQEQDLRMVGKTYELSPSNPNPARVRRQIIADCIKQLNRASDELLSAAKQSDGKNFKDGAKISDRIAKLSRELRQNLIDKGSIPKVDPLPLPSDDPSAQLRQLATTIDSVVEQLSESLTEETQTVSVSYIDRFNKVSRQEQACKKLEMLECQALSAHTLAKSQR